MEDLPMKLSRKLMMLLAVLLSFSLSPLRGDDDDDTADAGSAAADAGSDDAAADTGSDDYLGDGSLGTVVVEPGAQVQIRSLSAISGDVAFLGIPNQRGIEAAVADFGDIKASRSPRAKVSTTSAPLRVARLLRSRSSLTNRSSVSSAPRARALLPRLLRSSAMPASS